MMAEEIGPEKYAPPDRRPKETTGNPSQATANAVESEIREFVRRDVSLLRPRRNENNIGDSQTVEKLNMLIQRAAGNSIEEIDRVIRELESVRDMLRNEGERVGRELAGYESLGHAAATAMKVIGESIRQWKDAQHKSSGP
jgi:hypothetical protein